jgi:RNA polymerase sigma-70 factor (ECF subfamily)
MSAVVRKLDMPESNSPEGADDEWRLVEAARNGDARAFESLYQQQLGRVHALCWRLCGGNRSLAEEMTQDAFVRAWQKLPLFRGDSAFGTWLHRLTVNVVLGDRRTRLRRVSREQSLEDTLPGQLGGVREEHGLSMDLEKAISRLPERARTVLVLHDIEGYLHSEVAEMADMAVGTSKAQLHRARRLIREWMSHEHD